LLTAKVGEFGCMSLAIDEWLVVLQAMKFDNIRVASPVILVVNGRKLTSSCQAPSQVKVSVISE